MLLVYTYVHVVLVSVLSQAFLLRFGIRGCLTIIISAWRIFKKHRMGENRLLDVKIAATFKQVGVYADL